MGHTILTIDGADTMDTPPTTLLGIILGTTGGIARGTTRGTVRGTDPDGDIPDTTATTGPDGGTTTTGVVGMEDRQWLTTTTTLHALTHNTDAQPPDTREL